MATILYAVSLYGSAKALSHNTAAQRHHLSANVNKYPLNAANRTTRLRGHSARLTTSGDHSLVTTDYEQQLHAARRRRLNSCS